MELNTVTIHNAVQFGNVAGASGASITKTALVAGAEMVQLQAYVTAASGFAGKVGDALVVHYALSTEDINVASVNAIDKFRGLAKSFMVAPPQPGQTFSAGASCEMKPFGGFIYTWLDYPTRDITLTLKLVQLGDFA